MGEEITVTTLTALREAKTACIKSFDQIQDAGVYSRRPMFHVDCEEVEPARQPAFDRLRTTLTQPYSAVTRTVLADALVVGQGTVVAEDRLLLRESALEFLAHDKPPDGFQSHQDKGLVLSAPVSRVIDRPSILLQRPWFKNYGHWMVDSASLVPLIGRLKLPKGWQLVIGAQSSDAMRDVVLESLSLLAPGVGVIERPQEEVWRFEELHYIDPVHVPPLYKNPHALAGLRQGLSTPALAGPSAWRRLFVRRGPGPSRRLDNEAEIEAALVRRGFEIITEVPRSLIEQVRLFRSAEIIVGVKGAALTNAMFSQIGTHLVTLSPGDFIDPFFWDICAASDVEYSEIFGAITSTNRPISHNSFLIKLERLMTAIDAIEASK